MNPLEKHRWKDRVLIVSSPSDTSVGYKRQEQILQKGKKGMKERDLVIYRMYATNWVGPDQQEVTSEEAEMIRKRYKITSDEFGVVLVGKDGGVKLRKNDLVETRELFKLIDSMPMRQSEMKETQY